MPRDGTTNQYIQPSPDVVPDTTIESAVYNAFVGDIVQDLNHPRPIIAGGTGAINADAALINLKAEKASQVVTNYDSHVWVSGSFYSAVGATGAPDSVGSAPSTFAYVGTAMIGATADTIALEARNISDTQVPGRDYVREKKAGVWGAWASAVAALEANKVDRDGDVMTGGLVVTMASPNVGLNKTASGQHNQISGTLNAVPRWLISVGDDAAEGGANAGSNFAIYRYADDGTFMAQALGIERASGNISVAATLTAGTLNANTVGAVGVINAGSTITSQGSVLAGANLHTNGRTIYMNAENTNWIQHNGTQIDTSIGTLYHTGNLDLSPYMPKSGGTFTGNVHFNVGLSSGGDLSVHKGGSALVNLTSAGVRAWWAGALSDGSFRIHDASLGKDCIWIAAGGAAIDFGGAAFNSVGALNMTGRMGATGYRTRTGESGGFDGHCFNIHWNGATAYLYIDSTNMGQIYTLGMQDDPVAELTKKLEKALARIEALEARQPKEN
jgi:hypothetical protein